MISIIIPTYNHRDALEKCLASIAVQTYKDFEIIIIDDGSTDGTADAVRDFRFQISDFRFIRLELNLGANAARNRGWQEAKGDYLLFCDADVVMRPDMLAVMVRTLEQHPEVSYAYSSFKFGWKKFKLWPFSAEKLKRMPFIHSTSLIRVGHFPSVGWDESLMRLQDWDLFLTMLKEGHTGVWIPKILFSVEFTTRAAGLSQWIPSFAYRLPFLPSVKKYKAAEAIIRAKHHLFSSSL